MKYFPEKFLYCAVFIALSAAFFSPSTAYCTSDELLERARRGEINAKLLLADEYFHGRNRPANHVFAAYWFRRAAEKYDPRAQFNRAMCYENGWGVSKSNRAAFHWYEKAAKTLPEAEIKYAEKLFHGVARGVVGDMEFQAVLPDKNKALEILRKHAATNKQAGIILTKYLFADAPRHATELRALLEKFCSQPDPHSEALLLYAACLRSGIGGRPDPAAGAQMLLKAAQKNNPEAVAQLAEIYDTGSGLPRDRAKALELTCKAAGMNSPRALVNLGDRYLAGDGVDSDPAKAVQLYNKSSEVAYPPSLRKLGMCFEYGFGVDKDLKRAFENYKLAAYGGDDDAQFKLGEFFRDGKGVDKDPAASFYWFGRSAQNGDPAAMREVGIALISGRGVDKNRARGVEWIKRAAAAGDTIARTLLRDE